MEHRIIRIAGIDAIIGFLYFGAGNCSRMLERFFGLPRELFYAVYLLLFAYYILRSLPDVRLTDFLYYAPVSVAVAWGLIHYAGCITSRTDVFAVGINFYMAYIFFRLFDNRRMIVSFKRANAFATVYLLYYYFTVVRHMEKYSVNYAYLIAVPILCMAYQFLDRRNAFCLLAAAVMFMTQLVSGARGAMLLTLLCAGYYILCDALTRKKGRLWYILFICGAFTAIFVVLEFSAIVDLLIDRFPNSRNVQKLAEGSLMVSFPRERLYGYVTSLIRERPSGYGPLASRSMITDYHYPHSLLYELQLDFGLVPGAALFGIILLMAASNLIRAARSDMRLIVGFITIVGLGSLMISSSYYYEIYVPATIALFVKNHPLKRPLWNNPLVFRRVLRQDV